MENSTPDTVQYEGGDLDAMDSAKNYHKWILDCFRPYLGRRVAEVGAGTGGFSRFLLNEKIESLDCYEPSSDMFNRLKVNLKDDKRVTCRAGFFTEDSNIEKYDSIIYVNVLEHVENDVEELCKVRNMLNEGGHALIFVPALMCLYSKYDKEIGHYRRYTKKSLLQKTEQSLFKTVSCRWFDSMGILPWYFKFVLLKGSMSSAGGGAGLLVRQCCCTA